MNDIRSEKRRVLKILAENLEIKGHTHKMTLVIDSTHL